MIVKEIFNPFPGLRAFEEDEDYLFFGREKQIDDLLKKLRTTHFIAVIGASGSGKSSLVKCGLLPALHSGYMTKAGSSWRVAVFRPGDDPIGNLAKVLAKPGVMYDDEAMENTYASITEATLRRSNLGLIEAVKQSPLTHSDNLLIVVDQFEELFRFSKYERNKNSQKRDSLSFVDLFLQACNQEEMPIYVVLTMRSDFMGDCTIFPGLPEAINKSQYLIPRLSREERKEVISGPIAVGGGTITQRLLTQLLNDVGDNPDQLPILQHALLRTWMYWKKDHKPDEPIDIRHYETIGTMREALSQHAEEAYQELKSEKSKKICEVLFKTITEKGETRQGIRKPTKLIEVCQVSGASLAEVIEVIETFRKEGRSFLMPPAEVVLSEDSIIDISHESLMRIWDRLIKWVEEETQSAETYKRLAEAAALYQEAKSGLWRDPELQFAIKWYEESKPNRYWAQRYDPSFERAIGFLKESKRQEEFETLQKERQERLKIKRMRFFAIFLGSAAFISILLLIVALNLRMEATKNLDLAKKNEKRAVDEAAEAKIQRDSAEYQKREAERQKSEADDQREIAEDQRLFAQSEQRKALEEQEKAKREKDKADSLKELAFKAEKEAFDARDSAKTLQRNAEKSEKVMSQLRLLALSRTLALQAIKTGDSTLRTLLALQAYKFSKTNGGHELNQDIYNALASVGNTWVELAGHKDGVRSVALHQDEKIVSGSNDNTVRIWNRKNVDAEPTILEGAAAAIRSVVVSPTTIIAGDLAGNILVWSRAMQGVGPPTVIKAHNGGVSSLAIDSKATWIVSGGADGMIKLIRLNDLKKPPLLLGTIKGKIINMTLTPDESSVAVASGENIVKVYNTLQPGDAVKIFRTGAYKVKSVRFSPDGKYLAAGTNNGTVIVWATKDQTKLLFTLEGHTSSVNDIEFSPNNKLLASASSDRTIRLWDYTMPDHESVVLTGHTGWVWDIAFDSRSTTLISASEDRTLRTWLFDINELENRACKKVGKGFTEEDWKKYIGDHVKYEKNPCSD